MWNRFRLPASAAASICMGGFGGQTASQKRWKERSERLSSNYARCESATVETFVTYNVLSNHLAGAFLKRCSAAELESGVRMRRIQGKLADPVARRALIGLQEVSLDWGGEFHTFFARHGYHVVFAPYGEAFNGRMGVMLAYPAERFVAESIRLHHVGDSLPKTPSSAPATPPHLSQFGILSAAGMAEILGIHREALNLEWRYAPKEPTVEAINPRRDREWGLAVRRQNIAVLARLRPIDCDVSAFCVGVYHMPCLFGSCEHRQTQNIHVLALKGALAGMAKTAQEPLVLLGDFNLTPDSTGYSLLSGASLGDESAPDTERYRRVYNDLSLASAYALHHGAEPGPRTLDYIWLSDGCSVLNCPALDAKTPRPSASEPSDHLMVEAVVKLPMKVGGVAANPQPKNEPSSSVNRDTSGAI